VVSWVLNAPPRRPFNAGLELYTSPALFRVSTGNFLRIVIAEKHRLNLSLTHAIEIRRHFYLAGEEVEAPDALAGRGIEGGHLCDRFAGFGYEKAFTLRDQIEQPG
jgi:hypothetical protein